MGDDDISPAQAVPGNGSGARAINKIAKSTNYSFSVGAGGGFVSGSYGKSYGGMKVLTDFVDMNGDRYPDIVTERKIQYTNALGGLSSTYIDHGKKKIIKLPLSRMVFLYQAHLLLPRELHLLQMPKKSHLVLVRAIIQQV